MKALPPGQPTAIPAQQGRHEVTALEYGRCALRTFRYLPLYGNFGSVSAVGNFWEDGTCSAVCLNDRYRYLGCDGTAVRLHEAPHENCTCGIYGTLTLAHLVRQYPCDIERIVAVIAAQGQTIIGDLGLVTQYARVVAYWLGTPRYRHPYAFAAPFRDARSHEEVAAAQFRDARRFTDLHSMLGSFGFDARRSIFRPFGFDEW